MKPLPLNLAQLVADATAEFLKEHQFPVEDGAQFALLQQGKTEEARIQQEIAEGKRSVEELKEGLKKLLAQTKKAAEHCQSPAINAGQVRDALRAEGSGGPWS